MLGSHEESLSELTAQLDKAHFELGELRLEKETLQKANARLLEDLDGQNGTTEMLDARSRSPAPRARSRSPTPPAPEDAGETPPSPLSDEQPSDAAFPAEDLQDVLSSVEGTSDALVEKLLEREERVRREIRLLKEASFSRLETERRRAEELERRASDLSQQKQRLAEDLTTRCERIAALEQVLSASTLADGADGSLGVADATQMRSIQQRLEQLVAVHRKLLRKYGRLEVDLTETRGKVRLRDERISQLEFHARQMGTTMRKQAQRHVEDIARLREQVQLLREEKREQASIKRSQTAQLLTPHSAMAKKVVRGGTPRGDAASEQQLAQKRAIRGGAQTFAPESPERRGSFLTRLFSSKTN